MRLRKMELLTSVILMTLVDSKPHYRQLVAERKTQSQTVNQTTQSESRRKTTTADFPNMSNLTEHTITGQSCNAISQNRSGKLIVHILVNCVYRIRHQVVSGETKTSLIYIDLISRVSTLQSKIWENGRGRARCTCSYISVTYIA